MARPFTAWRWRTKIFTSQKHAQAPPNTTWRVVFEVDPWRSSKACKQYVHKQDFLLHTLGIPLVSPCSQQFAKLVLASMVSQKCAILVAYLQWTFQTVHINKIKIRIDSKSLDSFFLTHVKICRFCIVQCGIY
jgi:hypothetical protein